MQWWVENRRPVPNNVSPAIHPVQGVYWELYMSADESYGLWNTWSGSPSPAPWTRGPASLKIVESTKNRTKKQAAPPYQSSSSLVDPFWRNPSWMAKVNLLELGSPSCARVVIEQISSDANVHKNIIYWVPCPALVWSQLSSLGKVGIVLSHPKSGRSPSPLRFEASPS